MGYTGPVKMEYGARTFSTHVTNREGTFSRKHTYGANSLFIHFYALFFISDTICADNKEKPMTGCKINQLKSA